MKRIEGWRKFTIAMAALVGAFALALYERLTPEFATVATIAVGAFTLGNTAEHYTRRNGGGDA